MLQNHIPQHEKCFFGTTTTAVLKGCLFLMSLNNQILFHSVNWQMSPVPLSREPFKGTKVKEGGGEKGTRLLILVCSHKDQFVSIFYY